MLDKVIFVCTHTEQIELHEGDYFGVDRGALLCAKNKIKMKLAVGDFDSVAKEDLIEIRQYADEVICLSPEKNQSDSEYALHIAIERGYKQGLMLGATGGRMDHSYVNQSLVNQDHFNLILKDEKNCIQLCRIGETTFTKDVYKYISFFALEDAIITLKNVKYPLNQYFMDKKNFIGLSNEILEDKCICILDKGKVICIQSND